MARFYENDRNTPPPRPPRPMPPGDVTRRPQPQRPMSPPMPSGPRGGVSNEESERRIRDARNLMPMPRRSEPRPMPPGLEGQQYLAPGGMGGRMSGELNALMSLFATPSRVARGAVEGGVQAVNPDFQMPDIEAFLRERSQNRSMQMPLPRSFDPITDSLLRAYMRQMQGGE